MASWGHPWTLAITKPSINTYSTLARDPKANAWRPTIWVVLAGLVATVLGIASDYLIHQRAYSTLAPGQLALLDGPWLLIGIVGSLIGFVIIVGVQHVIAQRLGGRGTFSQQAYVVGAILAPLLILTVVVASLPIINIVAPFIVLFGVVIEVMAIKAIYSFGWIKALLSSVVVWIVMATLLLAVILYMLGPTIGNIFSTTNSYG